MRSPSVSIVLFLAIVAISTAAVLVRLVPEMHPIGIAMWRTGLVGIAMLPALFRKGAMPANPKHTLGTLVAGFCLALHFWAWFGSLQHTTVMRSTVLVCLTPVWAGLLAWLAFKKPPSRRFWFGIGVALLGVWLMSGPGGAASQPVTLLGDGMAIAGGMLAGIYLTIGRSIRPHVDLAPYGALLCTSCAASLLMFGLLTGAPLGVVGTNAWWAILAMAIGPQFMGHIGFSYAVRFVPAYFIGAFVLLEPVGATLLATVVLDEWPQPMEAVGAGIIALGVLGSTIQRTKSD